MMDIWDPNKWRIQRCCCGLVSLRTGCLIIAAAETIYYGVLVILLIVGLTADDDPENADDSPSTAYLIFMLIIYTPYLLVQVMFLIGILKEKPQFIKIWIYVELVLLMLDLIKIFIIGSIIATLIHFALGVYYPLVARSFMFQLMESDSGTMHHGAI